MKGSGRKKFFIYSMFSYYINCHSASVAVAKKTIHEIAGVEVGDMTAKVDSNTGNITEYRTAVKIAFGVKH
jgi:flavin-binding protein dodecin